MCKKILVHKHFKSLKKNLDQSFDEEIEQCPATMMKRRPNTSSGQKKTKTQESLQTTTSQMCPKGRFFWGPQFIRKT